MRARPVAERLWEKVDKRGPDECWEWYKTGRSRDGYGRIKIGRKMHNAHRVAYFLTYGYWPRPSCCHTCDNPPCCNPAHLFEGTQKANAMDASAKGRYPKVRLFLRGENHPLAKFTQQQVDAIRQERATLGTSMPKLAAKYGVSQGAIQGVVSFRTWQ